MKKISLIMFFAAMLFVSACKPEPEEPIITCDTEAQFTKVEGAKGFYGQYVIMLNNGTLLYPCTVDNNTINNSDIYEGMPITVSYRTYTDEEIACEGFTPMNAILPGGCFEYYKARITCIGPKPIRCGTTTPGLCGTK